MTKAQVNGWYTIAKKHLEKADILGWYKPVNK